VKAKNSSGNYEKDWIKMRLVSIIGDSISTYAGYQPEGYKVYYNEEMQRRNSLFSVYDTWWAKVNQSLKACLCVNNSYSGRKVTGTGFPAASCDERLTTLHTDRYQPDIILIYIGCNDFGQGVQIAQRGLKFLRKPNMLIFSDAYEHMLIRIHQLYPKATIVCGTLMRTCIKHKEEWTFPKTFNGVNFEDYNAAIRKICKKQKCCLADLASLHISYETLDGSHPTKKGHITIAHTWLKCLSTLGFMKPSIEFQ